MYDVIREAGAQQPVVWSHNWHRYRNGNPDIFKGALASKAEAVACCNYPGQDLVPQDYWSNPKDLTSQDYSGWFNQYFDDVNGYGWLLLPEYAGKAKTVYEFETFFNQSAYLYPIQAQYFRALGVQCASMWTYTMQEYALPLRFAFPEPHVHAEKSRQLHRSRRNLQIHPAGTDV